MITVPQQMNENNVSAEGGLGMPFKGGANVWHAGGPREIILSTWDAQALAGVPARKPAPLGLSTEQQVRTFRQGLL